MLLVAHTCIPVMYVLYGVYIIVLYSPSTVCCVRLKIADILLQASCMSYMLRWWLYQNQEKQTSVTSPTV